MLGLALAGIAVMLVRQEREACKSKDIAPKVNQIGVVVGVGEYFEDEDDDDGDDDEDDADVYTGPYCGTYRNN
jgi:regulator of RNase E activity RraB